MIKKEKEYIEAEIIVEEKMEQEKGEKFKQEKKDDMEEQIKMMKKTIMMQGFKAVILPLLVFLFILGLIIALIFLIFDTPFD